MPVHRVAMGDAQIFEDAIALIERKGETITQIVSNAGMWQIVTTTSKKAGTARANEAR